MTKTEEQLLEILKSKSNFELQFVQAKTDYQEIADEMKSSSRTIYRLLKKLEAQGLVKKLENGLILIKTSGNFQPKPQQTATFEPAVGSCGNFNKLIEAGFIGQTNPSAKQFLAFLENNEFDFRLDDFIDVFLAKNQNRQLKNKYAYFIKSWQNWKSQPIQHPKSSFAPKWAEKLLETFN